MRCRPLAKRNASPTAAPARSRLMRRPSIPSPCPLPPGEGSASGFRAIRMRRGLPSPLAGEGGSAQPRRMRGRAALAAISERRLAGKAATTLHPPLRGTFSRKGRREEVSGFRALSVMVGLVPTIHVSVRRALGPRRGCSPQGRA